MPSQITLFHFTKWTCNDSTQMEKIFTDHPDLNGVIHFAAYKAVV